MLVFFFFFFLMFLFFNLKYVIIIYANLGSAHESSTSESKPFQSQNSRLSQAGRMAEPFQIETVVLN